MLAAGGINILRASVSSLPASLASFYRIVPNVDNATVLSFLQVFTGGTYFFSCVLLLEKSKTSLADETTHLLCHSSVMSFVKAHSFSSYIPLCFAISYLG